MTNAHSVQNFVQVRVKRRGEDQKFIADVVAINEECDCALLTVHDVRTLGLLLHHPKHGRCVLYSTMLIVKQ